MPPAKGGGGRAVHCPRPGTAEATHLHGRRPCSTPRALEASFALPRNTHCHSSLLGIEVPEIGHFYSTYPPLNQQLMWQRRKATASPTTYVAAPQGKRQQKKDGRRGRAAWKGGGRFERDLQHVDTKSVMKSNTSVFCGVGLCILLVIRLLQITPYVSS